MTYPYPYPVRPSSSAATAAMVFGLIGIVTGCCSFGIPSLLAVIFGHVGMRATARGMQGRGLAVAGLVMGYLVIGPAIVGSVWLLFMNGLSSVAPGIMGSPTPTPSP